MNTNDNILEVQADTNTVFRYVAPEGERRQCICGCGLQVVKKAVYRPGHDARHVSQIVIAIVEFVENPAAQGGKRALTKVIREGFAAIQTPRLAMKLADRLIKNLGEKHALTVMTLAQERIEALEEETDEED